MVEKFNSMIVCGCVIVRGGRDGTMASTETLEAAKRMIGEGVVISPELARIWGAAFVAGQAADLATLRAHPRTANRIDAAEQREMVLA